MLNFLLVLTIVSAPVITIFYLWLAAHSDGWTYENFHGFSASIALIMANFVMQAWISIGIDHDAINRIASTQFIIAFLLCMNWAFRFKAFTPR